jgi:YfiR/HmsC-like
MQTGSCATAAQFCDRGHGPAGAHIRRLALTATLLCVSATGAFGQSPAGPDVAASFVLNFAKFTEWPDLNLDDGAMVVCVANDDRMASALEELGAKGLLDSRQVKVKRLAPDQTLIGCQIVFIGSQNPRLASTVLEESARGAILTVSDASRFAEWGGMVELFQEKGRVRIAVNVDAVGRSKLHVSSRILGLAKIVRDTNVR